MATSGRAAVLPLAPTHLANGAPIGLGLPGAIPLLVAMEAGLPIPVPSDVVILFLGERASAGRLSPVVVFVALELVAVAGTTVLFVAARGGGQAAVARFGARIGLTEARLRRAATLVDRKGRGVLVIGRATPGLRTVTAAAAGLCHLPPARALPALILGSSLFIQLHFVLGYTLGPLAREAIDRAAGPALAILIVAVVAGVGLWLGRRGRRAGAQAATEACCPACLALGLFTPPMLAVDQLEPRTGD